MRGLLRLAACTLVCAVPLTVGLLLPTPNPPVMEDERGWDCRSMGNLDCGPTDTTLCAPVGVSCPMGLEP